MHQPPLSLLWLGTRQCGPVVLCRQTSAYSAGHIFVPLMFISLLNFFSHLFSVHVALFAWCLDPWICELLHGFFTSKAISIILKYSRKIKIKHIPMINNLERSCKLADGIFFEEISLWLVLFLGRKWYVFSQQKNREMHASQ